MISGETGRYTGRSMNGSLNSDRGPVISVIIPVYNTERYLKDCLGSVVSQTYRNLEIILIDDGSTDESGRICDEYGATDRRIRVRHKENRGRSEARNDGLEMMTGDYFTFVDSDDILKENAIERLVGELLENSDVVCARIERLSPGNNTSAESFSGLSKTLSQDELLECFALDKMHGSTGQYSIDNGVVARLYSSSLRNIRFAEDISFAEDYLYSMEVFLKCGSVCYLDFPVYLYRRINPLKKQFREEFKNLSLERTEARFRALKLVKEFREDIYLDYLIRSYYAILDTYCTCIELGAKDSADRIASRLDRMKRELKSGGALDRLSPAFRMKIGISFFSYRVYSFLYRMKRGKELSFDG